MAKGRVRAAALAAAASMALTVGAAWAAAEDALKDWRFACAESAPCRIETEIRTAEDRVVARLALRKRADGKTVGELILPLGLHIPSGVQARVDQLVAFAPELLACVPGGCHAAFPAEPKLIEAMRKGRALEARVLDARSGKEIGLSFSLMGFTAASEALATH